MPEITIKIKVWECERCKYTWKQRGKSKPLVCPKCKSPRWDMPKKEKK